VSTWVAINDGETPDGSFYWSEDIGYDKINNKWGIAIRAVSGHYQDPDNEHCESWLFSDAPRRLRIPAVAKIPDLLDKLGKETDTMAKKIKEKTEQAEQLAAIINNAASESGAKRK